MSNLAEQIREALSMFARNGTEPALIGGLAVVAHQVVRATKDVDFLVEAEAADRVHAALLDLGYQCLYRSEDAANYVRAADGLDLLYAHRPLARRLLAQLHVTLDPALMTLALTHRSYAYENGGLPTNERLEFLGDSVLGIVVTETLYANYPDWSEGQLAKLRAALRACAVPVLRHWTWHTLPRATPMPSLKKVCSPGMWRPARCW